MALTAATPSGASIRYTIDGSTPSETAGTLYTAAIAVSSTITIKAIAYATNWADSAVASATYTMYPSGQPIFSRLTSSGTLHDGGMSARRIDTARERQEVLDEPEE